MNTDLKGVHLEISQRTRDYVDKKLPRLAFAEDLVTDLLLAFSREKSLYKLTATINFRWGSSTRIHVENFKLTEGIDALFDDLALIYEGMDSLGKLQAKQDTGATIWKMIKKPQMFWPIIKYWNSTASEMLANYIHDEKLIALFVQLMAYTGMPADEVSGMLFAGMWVSYHHVGFCYFEGGSGAVTKALGEVVEENGGEILLNTLATKIVVEEGAAVAVQTKDGKEFKCRYVVSNANAPDTFFKMVGREYLPEEYAHRLETRKIGLPAFAVYLGVDHDFSDAFEPEGNHSYFINPGYDQTETFKYFREGNPEKAMFGMINFYLKRRHRGIPWKRYLSAHVLGFILCSTILAVTVVMKFREGGWLAMCDSPQVGGDGFPMTIGTAVSEIFYAAGFYIYGAAELSHAGAKVLEKYGTYAQKDLYMTRLFSGEWMGTMCLTEPDAGSDVGAVQTTAKKSPASNETTIFPMAMAGQSSVSPVKITVYPKG